MNTIKRVLEGLDMSDKEIDIYLACLKIGTVSSSQLQNYVKSPQSTIKYTLENLENQGLLIKSVKGNTTFYTPENPRKLKALIIQQKNKIEEKERAVDSVLGDLIDMYKPNAKVPKVTFYDGLEGIQKVFKDSLTAKETICGYTDLDSTIKNIAQINKRYAQMRKKYQIKKKAIISCIESNKVFVNTLYGENDALNEVRFLDTEAYDIYISFSIYDNKIAYITLEDGDYLGVIVENDDIYKFHKSIFQFMWDHLEKK